MSERLDQIESLLLQLSTAVVRHDNQLERIEAAVVRHDNQLERIETAVSANAQAIAELKQTVQSTVAELRAQASETVQWFGEVWTRVDEMQSEVRGLQTESRRILERLENRDRGE